MPFDGFLNDEQIRKQAPSVFATQPHNAVSAKYAFLPTYQAVRSLRVMGLEVVSAREGKKRNPGGREYAFHELRLRRPSDVVQAPELGGLFPEAIVRNSHDRTSGYQLSAGMFRLICLNGMTASDNALNISLRHVGAQQVDKLAEAISQISRELPRLLEVAQDWNRINLSSEQVRRFAARAVEIRGTSVEPYLPHLIRARHAIDESPTLWNMFSRLQENLTKGGIVGRSNEGRRRTVRAITSLSTDVDFNKKLWAAASDLAAEVRPVSVVMA